MLLSALAKTLGAELMLPEGGAGDVDITGVAPIEAAGEGQVTFLTSPEYARYLATTGASAVIVGKKTDEIRMPLLLHPNPYWAFAKTAQMFAPKEGGEPFLSDKAHVEPDAEIAADVTLHPFVYVGAGARIGSGSILYPGVYVGPGAEVGRDCILRANAVIEHGVRLGDRLLVHAGAVIGGDGFGFAPGPDGIAKIPQTGGVQVGDDCEVGPNATIDRGAMSDTVVGEGCKLDSHAHVAHNCRVGKYTMICGLSALGGSSKLGERVIIGGHSAVNNHVDIGDNVILGGHSAITKSLREPGVYLGFPATPQSEWRKAQVALRRLPDLVARLKDLERRLEGLESALEPTTP